MGKHEMAMTTARLLAEQLRIVERKAERYEAALRAVASAVTHAEARRIAQGALQ
ncbi:MAG: hypothetical protein OJJ21_16665 [Ferrovibrio sp.]|uniref:hypothetical protein n=1 Tax=Ferrovibrio sp. TaxID=1917215 RepID=UPI00260CF2A5|nr:hypothetical protein [Ferrovibrio sp.]MCW0235235.1 hypothetical protein [Ferrovibrio sp.]